MPELPEVETVRAGLEKILQNGPVIERVELRRKDIRFQIPLDLPKRLKGQTILSVRRRAKYLLLETPKVILLSHLGMTGSWRIAKTGDENSHDHCVIYLHDGRRLVYRDPRRFGLLDLLELGGEKEHPRLKDLGPEPLDEKAFTAEYLFKMSRSRSVASKVFIMNQNIVVGVGNIYASEAMFAAGIRPHKNAGRLTLRECERLVSEIRKILAQAIEAGGSSIRDFQSAYGIAGGFQKEFRVYDRAGESCPVCKTTLKAKVMGGRSTFWCPNCQD